MLIMQHIILIILLSCGYFAAGALPYKQDFPYSNENRHWADEAQDTLKAKLEQKWNMGKAKNVIMFLGDGLGFPTITASRIYKGQLAGQAGEDGFLSFDKFPHIGLSKTYSANHQIADSASTGTAYLCGVKANFGTLGVSHEVSRSNCSQEADNLVTSILDWSLTEGKSVGLISTARITHASPGAAYANSANRNWEVDSKMPDAIRNGGQCKDIARQLIEDNPNINVLLGGGRAYFHQEDKPDVEYPDTQNGSRKDGMNLIQVWLDRKKQDGTKHAYVWNKDQFDDIKPEDTDYLLGLFEPSHMKYTLDARDSDIHKDPTITEMTEKAIKILQKNEKGFFLFVEGARIDHAHHEGKGRKALRETLEFADAVQKGVDLTSDSDTLIVVTADHSHTFHMTGYTSRGTNILGVVDPAASKIQVADDNLPYLTIGYADGPGSIERTDLSSVDTTGEDYLQPSKVPMAEATHGGEEVPIYARGPMSHLFSGVVEQHYIAHAMAYASCVGTNKGHCEGTSPTPQSPTPATCAGPTVTSGGAALMLSLLIMTFL